MSEVAEVQNHEEMKPEVQKEETEPQKSGSETEKQGNGEVGKDENIDKKGSLNDTSAAEESMIVDSSVNAEKSEDADAGDDEASDDSDSDESLPPGLLERPVEILESKRERKKIKRYTYDDDKPSPSAKGKVVEIPKGNGIPLRNHPRVEHQLSRNGVEDLKIIHRFFYGIPGQPNAVKKNIREFCGFVMAKDSPQYEKKEDMLGKFTVDNLKWAMKVCDVPPVSKAKKENLIDAFMEWCLCPKPQDLPVKSAKKEKSEKKKTKKVKKRSSSKMENGNTTSDTTPVKKSKPNPLKRKKKVEKKNKPSGEKKAKIKMASPKPKTPKYESDSSDDDSPLRKKSPPTNAEIRKYVEGLLKDADLETMTMKVVFQQVYEHYPEHDLTDRRSFIKETVKKIIS